MADTGPEFRASGLADRLGEPALIRPSSPEGQPSLLLEREVERSAPTFRVTPDDETERGFRASLDELIRVIERVAPGMRGSILLLDEDRVTVRHGAAPHLPAAYIGLIDGERIGPVAGSCGTAMYRHEQVIVREIATDPLWVNYKLAAEPFGLAACWSTPIFDDQGEVLGSFAFYYDHPREPTASDLELTETAAALAARIITGARAMTALQSRTATVEQLAATLERSEKYYRQMADAIPDMVWNAAPNGRVEYVNARVVEYIGRPREQVLGEGWGQFVHPDDLERVRMRWAQSVLSGTLYQSEFRLRGAGGSYRCFVAQALPMRDDSGRIRQWFGTCTDINDQRRVEAALRESQELLQSSQQQLHAALEASTTSTWRWDMETNGVDCDEGLYHLFGIDPATATGSFELFVGSIHADDRDRVIAAALRCKDEGVDLDEEFRTVWPDGSIHWAVDKGKVVFGDDGKPRYLIGACVDITERRMRDAQVRALAESLPQLAWMADASGARYWYNQRWYDFTGGTPEDCVGWGWQQFHHPEHLARVTEGIRRAWEAGEPWEDTYPLRGKDGQYRWFLSRAVPIRDADGTSIRWFGTNTDITEVHESRLARDRALAEAERANKAKSQFLAAMSHDLRTPLNAIGGFADLTAEGVYGPVTDGQRDALGRIRRAGTHLLTLINDILNFAKIEAGRVHLEIADFPVDEVILSASSMIELQARAKGLSFESCRSADSVQVHADREHVTEILTNLLTNSVKFTDAGSIALTWCADRDSVLFEVRDTGRGIPADKLASVFEPFVQAGRSEEEKKQGVGLGLAISRELARAMKGDLSVDSAVGRGSTFTLSLPRGHAA